MQLFTPGRRVIITAPALVPAMRGHSGVVEIPIDREALPDTTRGDAAIIRMDDPMPLRYLMFYAAECAPLDPQQSSLF